MKIMLPLISSMLMTKFLNLHIIILSTITLSIISKSLNNMMLTNSSLFNMDYLSMILILLTLISTMLIIISSYLIINIVLLIPLISVILMTTFSLSNTFHFYIFFEIVLIPTMILITKMGNQPERLQAGIYLLIYTITASLPLLLSILFMKNNSSFLYLYISLYNFKMSILLMLAFLVKMPMFMTHLWLPKAHVEAPLEGSMILAAVLLKLGGYGLMRFMPICLTKIYLINPWIISISILGATATGLNCVRQKDLKSLIAYSSVAHMGLVLCSIFSMNQIGLSGAILMMIAHGMSSSALFLLVNDLYMKTHSRNIIMFKGLLIISPNIIFWWFIFMAINISAPPSINTMSEIFIMSSLIIWSKKIILPIAMASLMTATFSLSMFINITHNKNEMSPHTQTSSKIFLSLFSHMAPLILLIMKMETITMYLSSLKKTMICGIINSIMYPMYLIISIMIPMTLSITLLYSNIFISIELPLLNMHTFNMPISIILDWTSCLFLTSVMLISSMILIFSLFYMPKKEFTKFFILLMMFVLSMMMLILSDNLIFILLGWDGLGLSSYMLVIYYQNFSTAASGSITLLSNRIGDIMILLTISILTMNCNWNLNMNEEYQKMSMILLMTAALTKSAQFPFSAWLPAAMAAPTPISALVHSSTLVTAGVYLLIRIANNIHPFTLTLLMLSSSITAIYASMSANWEQDMKKIIALSTLSQIAMMMFAISMKSITLAFFHLIAHALFKSTMFLCAGIMIHNSSYQDMRMMSTNSHNSPLTPSILGISSMALMGIPFTSGFFSKDTIIESTISSKLYSFMSLLMLISIGLTTTYTIRMTMMSNKFTIKTKPDYMFHNKNHSNIPISILTLTSISLGAMLLWMMNPEQIFILPNQYKPLIIMSLILGMITGITLSYKSFSYINMGEQSISLWFIHFMSTHSTNPSTHLMKHMLHNDNTWQEKYGPQGTFILIKNMSTIPNTISTAILLSLTIMFTLPLIM